MSKNQIINPEQNIKNTAVFLIDRYTEILKQDGEPDEAYKYLAIDTFQQYWDIEAQDFYQMFRNSFSKVANLLYQNSWGFIEKSAQLFPDEVREMFRGLYDESIAVKDRIQRFQASSNKLLPKVKEALNRKKFNSQQDERTISVYLSFRFPESYILYKAEYYTKFCQQLNIKPQKSGSRFLHLQELANEIVAQGVLQEKRFLNTYRDFYPKPYWDDRFLMIQNVLYVSNKGDDKAFDFLNWIKRFDK